MNVHDPTRPRATSAVLAAGLLALILPDCGADGESGPVISASSTSSSGGASGDTLEDTGGSDVGGAASSGGGASDTASSGGSSGGAPDTASSSGGVSDTASGSGSSGGDDGSAGGPETTSSSGGTSDGGSSGGGPTCSTDSECPVPPDLDACLYVACLKGQCNAVPKADGSDCDDGNACTSKEACITGKCAGEAKDCDDADKCSADGCDPATGQCSHTAIVPCGEPECSSAKDCDDHNVCTQDFCGADAKCVNVEIKDCKPPCTADAGCNDGKLCTKDSCTKGQCQFAPVVCDDGDKCTADTCDPATGQCAFQPIPGCSKPECVTNGDCADADGCTTDLCAAGKCVHAPEPNCSTKCKDGDCDDQNPCTDDKCEPASGCVHAPNTAACDDGYKCTGAGKCASSKCIPGPAKDCADDDPCTKDGCSESAGGTCTHEPISGCGGCAPNPASCKDDNPCTDDSCDIATGKCVHAPSTAACDDGDPCNSAGACKGGKCRPGTEPTDCDDQDACTKDGCEADKGCVHTAIQGCGQGSCASDKECADHSACTIDQCATASANGAKQCVHTPLACDDGIDCTKDGCDAAKGCAHAPNPGECDDGNLCTDDLCDPKSGCRWQANAKACSDGSACTEGDGCQGGKCHAGKLKPCDDGHECTLDGCEAKTGACLHKPVAGCVPKCKSAADCADGDACTGDICGTDGVCGHKAVLCDDGKACTLDTCSKMAGCQHAPADKRPCDDGDACTGSDTCVHGQCLGSKVSCDDHNPCTDDSCAAGSGCLHKANGKPCEDGAKCTTGDRCEGGECASGPSQCQCKNDADCAVYHTNKCLGVIVCKVGPAGSSSKCEYKKGTAVTCPDGGPCLLFACEPGSGMCGAKPIHDGGPCSDGNSCTVLDRCKAGKCAPGAGAACDDHNPCTDDGCDSGSPGGCYHKVNAAACDDGDKCTGAGRCKDAKCTAGASKSCNDGDLCTFDSCDPAGGACLHKPIPGCAPGCKSDQDCKDDNACTTDTCKQGKCANQSKLCDDGNACTVDACDPKNGACLHAAKPNCPPCKTTKDCDDGDKCTGDFCNTGGSCSHVPVPLCGGYCFANSQCGDGKACTTDRCVQHTCTHAPKDCGDNLACTLDSCEANTGKCRHLPIPGCGVTKCKTNEDCDDGKPCTTDYCGGGLCKAAPQTCEDHKKCTADTCDAKTGKCVYTPIQGCDPSACLSHADCDDSNGCTTDRCYNARCRHYKKNCNDNNNCTLDVCEPATGGCKHEKIVGCGGNCNTHSDCKTEQPCVTMFCGYSGKCFNQPLTCNDHNQCTTDACDLKTGKCTYSPVPGCKNCKSNADCADGKPCTIDRCYGGLGNRRCYWSQVAYCAEDEPCTSAAQCDDKNYCTRDSCYTGYGVHRCRHVTVPNCDPTKAPCKGPQDCDDGKPCTNDNCYGGKCYNHAIPNCQQDKPCKSAADCNDKRACTLDTCDAAKCNNKQKTCVDGNPCTYDGYCNQHTGKCINNSIPNCTPTPCKGQTDPKCNDQDKCTLDLCVVGFCNSFPIPGCK